MPGLYDPVSGVARFFVNFPTRWDGTPVAEPVSRGLGLPAVLINDARAFGLAELRLGAGRGASAMVGLTLGTGVGGVIAVDGQVRQGHDGTAGEIQQWTPTIELLHTPDIDECLDSSASKQQFWAAFKVLGDWYENLPPY